MLTPLQICFAVALGLLTTGTAGTALLLRKNPGNATLLKVRTIVRSWWIIVGCFLAALSVGKWGVLALFYAVGVFGLAEYFRHSRIEFKKGMFLLMAAAMTVLFGAVGAGGERPFLAFPGLIPPIMIPLLVVLTNSVTALPMVMAAGMGLLLFSYFMAHIPALVHLHPEIWTAPDQELLAVALLFLLTESNDVFQFISGKLFGRRKPLPQISPNKTEAGFIGGCVLTTTTAVITLVPLLDLSVAQAIAVGAAIFFVGTLGDLIFSTIKRYFGTKDFSEALPGHGGILDRIDSLVLTAPVYYHLLLFFKGVSL